MDNWNRGSAGLRGDSIFEELVQMMLDADVARLEEHSRPEFDISPATGCG